MKFKALPPSSRTSTGKLVYRAEEYSFDFEPAPLDAFSSVSIDNLNLEVDHDGRLVSIWGMCPHATWQSTSMRLPSANRGDVFIVLERPLVKGVSVQINENESWPVYVDRASGWVKIQNGRPAIMAMAVNALPSVIVEITPQDDIAALWLKPTDLPKSIPPPPTLNS